MAILIMDCEGEGHIKGDVRVDHLVTYISLQMASVQLLNVDKILQPINLTRLKVLIYMRTDIICKYSLFAYLYNTYLKIHIY